jgi:hypothetical protein
MRVLRCVGGKWYEKFWGEIHPAHAAQVLRRAGRDAKSFPKGKNKWVRVKPKPQIVHHVLAA